jgi:hypothetical protein
LTLPTVNALTFTTDGFETYIYSPTKLTSVVVSTTIPPMDMKRSLSVGHDRMGVYTKQAVVRCFFAVAITADLRPDTAEDFFW